jgi:hypothetical protein
VSISQPIFRKDAYPRQFGDDSLSPPALCPTRMALLCWLKTKHKKEQEEEEEEEIYFSRTQTSFLYLCAKKCSNLCPRK